MSLGIVFKGPEGIVIAADSRVTLNTESRSGRNKVLIPAFYDNTNKLLRVNGQEYIGVVTYGRGAIGNNEPRTAHSYISELENELQSEGVGRLSVYEFSKKLSDFFNKQWVSMNASGDDMVFMVAGYDEGEPYGKVYEVKIASQLEPKEMIPQQFGICWGGQTEFVTRLFNGHDPALPDKLANHLKLDMQGKAKVLTHIKTGYGLPIPYQFLPLQDCVDLSVFLIEMTSSLQKWAVGLRGVGGAIDVVTITRTEGVEVIQQKSIKLS